MDARQNEINKIVFSVLCRLIEQSQNYSYQTDKDLLALLQLIDDESDG